MDVRLPDGTIVTNVPDGTTQGDLMSRLAKMREPAAPSADAAEQVAGHPATRFALGAASPIIGAAQFLANSDYTPPALKKAVNEHIAQLEAMKNKGMAAAGTEGMDIAGLAGTVLSPVGLKATKMLPVATTLAGKVGQGALVGAGFGAATPVTNGGENFGAEKAMQAGVGALTGGAVTGGIQALKGIGGVIGSAVESATDKGRKAILDRFQKELAGDARPSIISALENAKTLVPGSAPTAGEAIAAIPESTALAAHQRAIAKTPIVSGAFEGRADAQEAARKAALGAIAKTPQELEAAVSARSAEALNNYSAAYATQIRANPELAQLMKNPFVKDEIPTALKLSVANGISPKTDLTQFLHYIKIGLDKQLSKTGNDALTSTQAQSAQTVKSQLLSWMEKANPQYEKSRAAFAAASKPINQMRVGQYMQDKLVSPLTGGERAASYAQARRDAPGTIKRSTGTPIYDKLSQVLEPAQEQAVISVGDDLTRQAQYLQRAAGTNLTGASNVAEAMQPRLPNLLSRPAMILNAVMKHLGSNAEDKINKLAGERYLDPQKLAEALKDVPVAQRGAIADLINQVRMSALIGGPATWSAQGILSQPQPALLNPNIR